MTEIVHDADHSDGAPIIGDTGIGVANVAGAHEYNGYTPTRSPTSYPALTLEDIHTAITYFCDHPEEFDAAPAAGGDDGTPA